MIFSTLNPVGLKVNSPDAIRGSVNVNETTQLKQGKAAKEHYAYVKNGYCTLLAAIEPLKASEQP